jgi:hypothetical protein
MITEEERKKRLELLEQLHKTVDFFKKTLEEVEALDFQVAKKRSIESPAVKHGVMGWRMVRKGSYRGGVSSVTCLCGEVTDYKIPLKDTLSFECPKMNKKKRG